MSIVPRQGDTRERLVDAGLRLFAERGFQASTVADLEREAGLSPGSGGLYQHFRGKRDLLDAVVENAMASVDQLAGAFELLPLGDLRAELTLLARWNLASLRTRAEFNRFLARDRELLSETQLTTLYDRLVALPYSRVTEWLRVRFNPEDADDLDVEALTVALIQSMAGYVALESNFGRVPGDVDDERFIAAWTQMAVTLAPDPASVPHQPA
jgi:AcrR family transcriptional regulator